MKAAVWAPAASAWGTTWELVTRSEPLAPERTTQPEPRPASVEMVNTEGSTCDASCDQSACCDASDRSRLISACIPVIACCCAATACAPSCCTRHARPAVATTPATSAAARVRAKRERRLPMFLPQLGPEGRLRLGDAEHRVVELIEGRVDLLHVVGVHAVDQLLHRGDARAEAVAQLAVRRRQLGGHLG